MGEAENKDCANELKEIKFPARILALPLARLRVLLQKVEVKNDKGNSGSDSSVH